MPDPGSLLGRDRGGAREEGTGRPHLVSREASAAAVPQLLRRMLFRVTGAELWRQRWLGGAKSEARGDCAAEAVVCCSYAAAAGAGQGQAEGTTDFYGLAARRRLAVADGCCLPVPC